MKLFDSVRQRQILKTKRYYWLFFGISVLFVGLYYSFFSGFWKKQYVSADSTVISCASNPTISVGPADATHFPSGADLVLTGGGTCILTMTNTDSPINLNSLTITGNTYLSHLGTAFCNYNGTVCYPGTYNQIKLNITNTLQIDSGSSISVSGEGYAGSNMNALGNYNSNGVTNGNVLGSNGGAGGSHGGMGGGVDGQSKVSPFFDSIVNPSLPGGGGGSVSGGGGAGGGVVIITAGQVVVNGAINANGGSSGNEGAGAGGTVNIRVNGSLTGSGNISAGGGNASATCRGGGGGGRISIVYGDTKSSSLSVTAAGGLDGGSCGKVSGAAGTIYFKKYSDSYGDLYVYNTGVTNAYYTTSLVTSTDAIPSDDRLYNGGYAFKSINVGNYGVLDIPSTIDSTGQGTTPAGYVRKIFCNSCTVYNNNLVDGEIVWNVATYGSAYPYTCVPIPVPTAPSVLYSSNSSASSGSVNPVNLSTLTPVFSSQCNSPDVCNKYEIQISTTSDFSTTIWDSGSNGIDMSSASNGSRTQDFTYSGSALHYNTNYYWRIRFWNGNGGGAWSTETATFYIPRAIELYNFNFGGAVKSGDKVDILWGSVGGSGSETVKIEYTTDGSSWNTIIDGISSAASTTDVKTYNWTVPNVSTSNAKIRITSDNDSNYSITSENTFTIQNTSSISPIKYSRTFSNSNFYNLSSGLSLSSGNLQVSSAGGLSGWGRRKQITITNGSSSALTYFETPITVAYDSDMNADFSDLRFTSSDGTTALNYYLESKTNSASASVWVKIPSIPASGSAVIYMYYGNSAATTASDGHDVFPLFEDWETGAVSSTYWTMGGNVSPSWLTTTADKQAGSYAGINADITDNQYAWIKKTISVVGSSIFEMYWKVSSESGYDYLHYCIDNSSCSRTSNTNKIAGSTSWAMVSSTLVAGSHNIQIGYAKDGSASNGTDTGYVDSIRVRQTVTPSLSSSFGSEESVSVSDQTASFTASHPFSTVNTFGATTSGTGSVKFQVTNDGNNWYYCTSDSHILTISDGSFAQSSLAADITDACLSSLTAGSFNVRVVFHIGAGQTAILSDVSFAISNKPINTAPTLSDLAITNLQDGTGEVKIKAIANDADADAVKIKTEYRPGDCSSYNNLAYTALVNSVSSTYFSGDIALNNAEANGYWISNIKTTSGSNEVWYYWNTKANLPAANGTYCVFLTPDDGNGGVGTTVSSTVNLDNVAPTAPGALSVSSTSTNSVTLKFGTATVDDNFSQYKIHYREGSNGVLTSDAALTSANDPNLGSVNFNGALTTALTGLQPGKQYVANIWAYDAYGNYMPASQEISFYTLSERPTAPTVGVVSNTSLNLKITAGNNPLDTVSYAICKVGTDVNSCDVGNAYVAADGTVSSAAPVWQTRAGWGGNTGINITGLSENVGYRFILQARNGDGVVNSQLSSASTVVYTYSGAVENLAAVNFSTTTTLQMNLTFVTTTQSGLRIEKDNGCDGTFDTIIYDNSHSLSDSPLTITNITPNTCYQFRILGYNIDGVLNNNAVTLSNQITSPPGQVTGITAENIEETEIDWSWAAVDGAANYVVYILDASGNITNVVDNVASNTYVESDLNSNATYYISVRAYNNNGFGIMSDKAEAVTDATVPAGLHAINRSVGSVTWSWNNDNQSSFWARENLDGGVNSGWTADHVWERAGLGANANSIVKVKARNGAEPPVETAYSPTASSYSAQNDPTGITFSDVTVDSITANAQGSFPNNGVGSAALYFSNHLGSASGAVGAGTSWINGGLAPNTQYTYTVYAMNSNASTTASVTASKYTLAATPGQITTAIGDTSGELKLTLNANNNPANTYLSLYCTSTRQYVHVADKTLVDDANNFGTLDNWGSEVVVKNLTPNTAYQFQALAKNGESILTTSSTDSILLYTKANIPKTIVSTPLSPTAIKVSWNTNNNPDGTEYWVEDTGNSARNSSWITDNSYTFNNLTPGSEYIFQVKARNHDNVETEFVIAAATAADPLVPGKIITSRGTTASSLLLTLDSAGNSVTTTYARIFCTTTGQYLNTLSKTLTDDGDNFATFNNLGNPIVVSGLTPNTGYQFDVVAKNTLGVISVTSTDSGVVYTRAAVPSDLVVQKKDSNLITISWSTNGNPDGTQYYVENYGGDAINSSWITANNYTFEALKSGTQYNFRVKAKNAAGVETDYTNILSVTTLTVGGATVPVTPIVVDIITVPFNTYTNPATTSSFREGGVSFVGQEDQTVLTDSSKINNTPDLVSAQIEKTLLTQDANIISTPVAFVSLPPLSGFLFDVNGATHTITNVQTETNNNSAVFVIRSEPKKVIVGLNEEKVIDINNDGYPDIYIKVNKINKQTGAADTTVIDLNDLPFTINNNFSFTTSTQVQLYVKGAPGVVQMGISENPDFVGSSFQPFSQHVTYELSPGEGEKKVYVRLRNTQGATVDISDTIIYASDISKYIKTGSNITTTTPITPKTSVTEAFTKILYIGYRNTEVARLQTFLKDLGHFTYSKITGYFGRITSRALVSFQKNNSLKPSGYLDQKTMDVANKIITGDAEKISNTTVTTTTIPGAIGNNYLFKNNLCTNDVSKEVRELQKLLQKLGYLKHVPTGRFATETKAAVKKFQIEHKLTPTGCVGTKTREELNKM